MKRTLSRLRTIIGGLSMAALGLGLGIGALARRTSARVPADTVLEADLERRLVASIPEHLLARVPLGPAWTVRDVVEALERAAQDKRGGRCTAASVRCLACRPWP
jgi:protease-4